MTTLAIDIGGSGSRARLSGGNDIVGPGLVVTSGRPQYSDVLHALGPAIDLRPEVVVIGAASLLSLGDATDLADVAGRIWPSARLVLVPDVVAGLVGAWGLDGGVIVAAGTGAIGLATDGRARWVRSDGWGHLLGDAGSGAWIGSRGLRAALRRHDGRVGGSEALLGAARQQFGDVARLPAQARSAANEASFLAGFAPAVAAAASAGDEIAAGILDEAGWQLAETAVSLLVDGIPRNVALTGGVTEIAAVVTAFERGMKTAAADAEVSAGGGRILDGAERLADYVLEGRVDGSRPPYITLVPARASGA